MTTLEKDDYAIIKGAKKNRLVKVTYVKNGTYKGLFPDRNAAFSETEQSVDFSSIEIIAALGTNPVFGVSYGVKIEPFRRLIPIEGLGNLFFFRKTTKEERSYIVKAFNKLSDDFRRDKIKFGKEVDFGIREPRGTMVGFYRHARKQDRADELVCCPPNFSPKELKYVLCHEAAHGIWFTIMDNHWRAKWVKAFTRNTKLTRIDSDRIKDLRKSLVDMERVGLMAKQLDDDDQQAFKECLRYMKRTYALSPRHIDNLLADGDDLLEYWPKNSVDTQHKEVLITQYATKSVDEFFAEAFGWSYSKSKSIPSSVQKLLDKTLAAIKAGMNGSEEQSAKDS
jgi:hypothetical protein